MSTIYESHLLIVTGNSAIPVLTKRSEHPQMRTVFSRPAPASEDASLRKLETKAEITDIESQGEQPADDKAAING
jgi:hypothetical protein